VNLSGFTKVYGHFLDSFKACANNELLTFWRWKEMSCSHMAIIAAGYHKDVTMPACCKIIFSGYETREMSFSNLEIL
jgi:hypothetical protein